MIFRFSASGTPKTAPAYDNKPKALSGYSLCQQRVTGASHRKPPISLKLKRDKPLNKPQITNHYQQIPFSKNKKKDHQTMAFSLKHPQKISKSPQ
ncbi:hypothetical protein AL475_12500 [Vibrio fluvialis]|uniref:hypothetical protein n=1 Tax=Vibrio fluvialis TaxID=676 RepID=UPI000CEB74B7|nr:hypothetical protein [Vibrio fluvialis]AVH32614.1 hypothetical protein AL475_12500 [Vibrio fluvialis]